MDDLWILGLLALAATPILVIVLVFSHLSLRRRVASLEKALANRAVAVRTGEQPVPRSDTAPDTTGRKDPARSTLPEAEGPWNRPAAPAPAPAATTPEQPQRPQTAAPAAGPVLPPARPSVIAARVLGLMGWLKVNWVYAVSAVSLALAGIFFVQYGVERGLLPPVARVALALAFGAAMITAGEWLRRRFGDEEWVATAHLPSVFSGAGIVSLFAGVLAARLLYGLIGVEVAFVGLGLVAALSILLGWYYGPLLAAVGLIGAMAAPFAVGGQSGAPAWLFAYFGLVAVVGLLVDAARRWAWVSLLSLILAYAAGGLAFLDGGAGMSLWYATMGSGLMLAAIACPVLSLTPGHAAPALSEAFRDRSQRPEFPVVLAGIATLAASLLCLLPPQVEGDAMALMFLPVVLAILLTVWCRKAPGLVDLAVLPAVAFLGRIYLEGTSYGPLAQGFYAAASRAAETAPPMTVSVLLALAAAGSVAAAWRSIVSSSYRAFYAAGAALFAPLAALELEFFWTPPATVIGAYPWALHLVGLAALMVGLAGWFAKVDGQDHRRAAYAALSALSLIAFSFFVLLSQTALTLALAALLVIAAGLDRRFRLPEMTFFIQAGVVVLGYRLIVDPGLDWADRAPVVQVMLAYGGAVLAAALSYWLLRPLERIVALTYLESAIAGFGGMTLNLFLLRWVRANVGATEEFSHWTLSLGAMTWAMVALVQVYRMQLGGRLNLVRRILAIVAGLIATGGLVLSVTVVNPALGWNEKVHGPLILDTMLIAYGLPAIVFWQLAQRVAGLPEALRLVLRVSAGFFALVYVALEIRRFWQGDDMAASIMSEGELYSYTVAMLLLGAGLLWQAIARRSSGLRRLAMAVIGLTIAKVFLIDASGLAGLTRVFSFLALGLSLAGLAWLNRWAAER